MCSPYSIELPAEWGRRKGIAATGEAVELGLVAATKKESIESHLSRVSLPASAKIRGWRTQSRRNFRAHKAVTRE
jgi:hypothetical protein